MLTYPLRALLARETCPVCQERFPLAKAPFRCTNDPGQCPPAPDPIYARNWGDQTPRAKVIPPPGPFTRAARCPTCHQPTRKRLCPHCHMPLPYTAGELKSYSLALVGARQVGKSHYIAVLIRHLRYRLGPAMDLELTWEGEETQRRYQEGFHDPVFEQGRTIDATRKAAANLATRLPLIYRLTVRGRNRLGLRRRPKAVNLVFYDSAGEDLEDLDVMTNVNRYIYRADGIILLLDPLQLPKVREVLSNRIRLPQRNSDTLLILERVAQLIRQGRGFGPTRSIPIPLALAFSKLDAIEPLLDRGSQLLTEADHHGGFDMTDSNAISGEMEAHIAHWQGDEALLTRVRDNFRRYRFFGLSALGCNPEANEQIPRVMPRRVEDPLLWLLSLHGLIPSRKRR